MHFRSDGGAVVDILGGCALKDGLALSRVLCHRGQI